MLNSNISLGDLAVYNGCSPTFWSSIIYEHFTPPDEHIYCRLPYWLNLNQFSLFEYDWGQVIQSFKYYLDNKKHAYSSNHISLWTTCNIRSPIKIFVSILCWIQIRVHWSRWRDVRDNLNLVFICINFGWIGTSFGRSFLQNWRFSQQASWFREGTCHLCVRNDIRCLPPDFLYRGNIELYECPVKF